jgi:ribosomal protein S27E
VRRHEAYVHSFNVPGSNVYRVTCPTCGEEYTCFDSSLERVEADRQATGR